MEDQFTHLGNNRATGVRVSVGGEKIEKARKLPLGSVSERGGVKYQKIAEGDWRRVSKTESGEVDKKPFTIKFANGKTVTVKPKTSKDFKKVRDFISTYFEGNFPFDVTHGNKSKTDFGESWYSTVDPLEEYFMSSRTIRISDHSTGHRRAVDEIQFNVGVSKKFVFDRLDLYFKRFKKK